MRLQTLNGAVSNVLFVKADPTPADQLVSVTSGSGLKTTLYYVPLSNPTPNNGVSADLGPRYQSDRGNNSYAVSGAVDLTIPMYVVATSVSDAGVGTNQLATEMSYLGLKADLSGRGLLGFREVLRQRPGAEGSPLTVDTQYLQIHPYIGVASSTQTYLGTLNAPNSGTVLSTTTNVYCDQTNAAAASPTANCPVSAKVARPYLYQSTETGQDLNRTVLPTVATVNTFNGSGDPTNIQVTTTGVAAGVAQQFVKSTTNAYQPDNTGCSDTQTCSWVLGRLSQASVTNSVPDSLASIPRSADNVRVTSASFNPASMPAGTSSSFSWSTANAVSATVSCSGAGANATGSGTSGTITVATSSVGTATCTVSANGTNGTTAVGSATLAVTAPSFDISITSSASQVSAGQTFRLTTTVTGQNASCTASNNTGMGWAGGPSQFIKDVPQQSNDLTITATTTFTLQCTSATTGTTLSKSVVVTLSPPFDVFLTTSASQVGPGQAFRLTSSITGQNASCTASNTSGLSWSGGPFAFVKDVAQQSSDITITSTTTFTLQCTSSDTGVTRSKSVVVTYVAPFDISLSSNTAQVGPGQVFRLTSAVSGQNASCTAANDAGGSWSGGPFAFTKDVPQQSSDLSITQTTIFTLQCTSSGTGVTRTKSVTVSYVDPFNISLSASTSQVSAGQPVRLTSSVSTGQGANVRVHAVGPKRSKTPRLESVRRLEVVVASL